MAEKYQEDIDLISRSEGFGDISSAAGNAYWGINHRGVGNPVPLNTDNHGLTFFTRPCLNLAYDNIAMLRQLTPLLTRSEYTQQRATRALLDRVGQVGGWGREIVSTPLVDPKQAFLTPLTNHLVSCTGWPDQELDTFTSKEGVHREVYSLADAVPKNYSAFDLTATFRNVQGDPISLLFFTWLTYIAAVTQGEMNPYPTMVLEKEIDYMTRIYRLVLDPTRMYVQRIAACGAAFPTANPMGAVFNFNADQPMSQEAKELSFRFRAIGVDYYDPISIWEFNKTVTMFNQYMVDGVREVTYIKLAKNEIRYFNYKGYPRINPLSSAMEWWVTKEEYRNIQQRMIK